MSTVPSVEALSITTTSRWGYFCFSTDSKQRLMNLPLLYVTSVTVTESCKAISPYSSWFGVAARFQHTRRLPANRIISLQLLTGRGCALESSPRPSAERRSVPPPGIWPGTPMGQNAWKHILEGYHTSTPPGAPEVGAPQNGRPGVSPLPREHTRSASPPARRGGRSPRLQTRSG